MVRRTSTTATTAVTAAATPSIRRSFRTLIFLTLGLYYYTAITNRIMLSLVGGRKTAGLRPLLSSLFTTSSAPSVPSRGGFSLFVAATTTATAFVPPHSTSRCLASQSWKPEILRGRDKNKPAPTTPVAGQDPKKDKGPRIIRRGRHLDNHKRRRDDTVLYRADRVLSNRTGQSRKECFALLQQRRVYQVLGRDSDKFESSLVLEVIPGPKAKISKHAALRIDRKHDVPLPAPLLMVYHKPKVGCCLVFVVLLLEHFELLKTKFSIPICWLVVADFC